MLIFLSKIFERFFDVTIGESYSCENILSYYFLICIFCKKFLNVLSLLSFSSINHNHIAQNFRSLDIKLHQSDIESLNELNDWMEELQNSEDELTEEVK